MVDYNIIFKIGDRWFILKQMISVMKEVKKTFLIDITDDWWHMTDEKGDMIYY